MHKLKLPENKYKLNLPLLKNFDYQKLDDELKKNKPTTNDPFNNTNLIEMKPKFTELDDLRKNISSTLQKEHYF